MNPFGKKNHEQVDLELFTIYDSKGKCYDDPMFEKNKDVLLRGVLNMMRDPENQRKNKYVVNAEDYSIFRIGTYDRGTGKLTPTNLEHIANMHDLRALAVPSEFQRDVQETSGAL